MYYYGPLRQTGHYFFSDDGCSRHAAVDETPWRYEVDGGLAPNGPSGPEGIALLHKKDGWTAISFWDRTVDTRPGSCSTYLAEGDFTFEQMVEMAKTRFAERWNRMKFEVRLV